MSNNIDAVENLNKINAVARFCDDNNLNYINIPLFLVNKYKLFTNGELKPSSFANLKASSIRAEMFIRNVTEKISEELNTDKDDLFVIVVNDEDVCSYLLSSSEEKIIEDVEKIVEEGEGEEPLKDFIRLASNKNDVQEYLDECAPWR